MFHEASSSDQILLAEWRWLLGGVPRLVGWSTAGDLFIADADDSIILLDPGSGQREIVADSLTGLRAMLSDPEESGTLLQRHVVEAFEATHSRISSGACLSYRQLPALGGTYTIENRVVLPIAEHTGVTGDIHRQLRDLPDGAQVQVKIVP